MQCGPGTDNRSQAPMPVRADLKCQSANTIRKLIRVPVVAPQTTENFAPPSAALVS